MRVPLSLAVAFVAVGRRVTASLAFGPESQKVLASGDEAGLRGLVGLQESLSFDPGRIVASVREDAQSPAACAACEAVLFQLKLLASRGDEFFVAATTELCTRSRVQDPDVCAGSIALEGPIIAHALRGLVIGSRTSRLVCVTLAGLCTYPDVVPHNVSFPEPEPRLGDGKGRENETQSERSIERKPLKVVHFSDIHIDPLYVEGATAKCTKPICCRVYTDADKPGLNDSPAGPNGEHTCDSPARLEESMYAAMRAVAPDAAFAVFTGDIVDHAVWDTSRERNALDIEDAYLRMGRAGMRVYGTAGNHEASPANSFPPATNNGNGNGNGGKGDGKGDGNGGESESSSQWLYDLLSSTWSQWIGPRAAATTREFGAYSVLHPFNGRDGDGDGDGDSVVGKLRIISLSTNMYYAHNYWLYEEPMQMDPNGQLEWLVGELDAAEKTGERVYITGHMPMGSRDAFHDGSNYFDQIVRRYAGTIAAMFFGHTHFDEFELSYADNKNKSHSNALITSYIAPSMTPLSGHPAFRVYDVDPVTFGVLDATTYIANASDPSFSSPSGPVWTRYYSAREAYGPLVGLGEEGPRAELGELTAAFWHNVTEAFERNATAFGEYFERRRRGWGDGACDEECRRVEVCKMRAARAEDNCIAPGFRLSGHGRVNEGPGAEDGEDECGAAVVRDTLGSVVRDLDMLKLFEKIVTEKAL